VLAPGVLGQLPSTCIAGLLERSPDLKVFGRLLATIAYNFVLDRLTLIKSAQACPLDSGNVNEHILPAALRLNESVPFGRVEPLHGSSSHHRLLAFSADQVARALPRGAFRDLENDLSGPNRQAEQGRPNI